MAFKSSVPILETTPNYVKAPWMAEATATDADYVELWGNVIASLTMYTSFAGLHHQILTPSVSAMYVTPPSVGSYDTGLMFVNAEQASRRRNIYPGAAITLMELLNGRAFDVKQLKVSYTKTRGNIHGRPEIEYFHLRKRSGEGVLDVYERLIIDFDFPNKGASGDYRIDPNDSEALAVAYSINEPTVEDTLVTLETPPSFHGWLEPRIGSLAWPSVLGVTDPNFLLQNLSSQTTRKYHEHLLALSSYVSRRNIGVNGLDQRHFEGLLKEYT